MTQMRKIAPLFAIIFSSSIAFASAQQDTAPTKPPSAPPQNSSTVERAVAVESGKVERIGVYVNTKPDCTSGPPPVLRIVKPPRNGKMMVELVNVQMTDVGTCPKSEGPGFIASYESNRGFEGDDNVIVEIKYSDRGDAPRLEKITINVQIAGTKL